ISVSEVPTPTLYQASVILVGAGSKQGTLGDERFTYDARHYLVCTSPVPMLCRTLASPGAPLLSLAVGIELPQLRELLIDLDELPSAKPSRPARSVYRAPLAPELEDAGVRLLECLGDERRTQALARATVREILFHVLAGPFGDSLRALAEGPTSQMAAVLRYMNTRFAQHHSIAALAQMAHMSVPTFHQHFKAMTASSPLQYLKAIRLTRARQMLRAGASVKTVAHDVGYASESQFSREYRRFFGAAPSASIDRGAA
ncbi:MAG TPA: AraC family transcriptional regulator, partial [Polyangiales bacterium]